MLPISLDTFLNDLSARVGVQYTDEQKAFMRDFTSPIISFSSPGTGKTKSAIGGLLTAELYHQVPGNQIYALSFTNMSTGELKVRHKQDCEKVGIKQTVSFQTLHSLCSSILKANYKLLGIGKLTVVDTIPIEEQAELLMNISKDRGISLHPWQIRPFINAVRSLNSSLVFDRSHVESKYAFKQCKMPYEDFTLLRKFLYIYTKMTDTLQVQDILLYTLELLLSHPEVSADFKAKCKILLVDEFQDLSLLQLRIISLLSDTVIAIGDIKQQIYAFNGACQEIVGEFKKYFPTARELNLNKSFRCADAIVDYVDLRITYPRGEDFIVLSHKRVMSITNQTLKVHMTEEEQHLYQAALVDFYLSRGYGSDLYLTKYVEPGIQGEAAVYYSVPSNIEAAVRKDPNIVDMAQVTVEGALRDMINAARAEFPDGDPSGSEIKGGRDELNGKVNSDFTIYEVEKEKKEQEASNGGNDSSSLITDVTQGVS